MRSGPRDRGYERCLTALRMSTGVSQNHSCDCWDCQSGQQALRALLHGDRVDAGGRARRRRCAGTSGRSRPRACRASPRPAASWSSRAGWRSRSGAARPAQKQWSITIATARGITPRPANSLVDPVADRGELRRAPHDVVDRHLAGEAAVDLDGEGVRRAGAGLPVQPADQAPNVAAGPPRRAARWRPTGSARPRCGAGRRARPARRDDASGRSVTSPARRQGRASRRLNGRSPRPARRRAPGRARARRARPSRRRASRAG